MKNGSLLCCIFNLQGQSWNLRAPRVVLSEIGRNQISWQSEPLQARDIASSPEFHQRHSDYPTSYEWRRICVHLWENLWLNRSCRYRSQKSKLIRNCGTKFFLKENSPRQVCGQVPRPLLRRSRWLSWSFSFWSLSFWSLLFWSLSFWSRHREHWHHLHDQLKSLNKVGESLGIAERWEFRWCTASLLFGAPFLITSSIPGDFNEA